MSSSILNNEGAHTFKYTTTGAVTVNSLLVVGSTPMVALEAATGSGQGIACAVGVSAVLPKKAAASTNWAPGGRVYYMTTGSTNKLTGVAAAGKLVGYGLETTATGATTGKVRLIAGPLVLETAT